MTQDMGGAGRDTEAPESDEAARQRAVKIAAQRAAADAAIAAVAGGKQALTAMTSASAAAAKAARAVETKRIAEREALAEEAAAAEAAAEAEGSSDPAGSSRETESREPGETAEEIAEDESEAEEVSEVEDAYEAVEEPSIFEDVAEGEAKAESSESEPESMPAPEPEPKVRAPRRRPAPARVVPVNAEPPVFEEAITRWLAAEKAPAVFAHQLRAEFGEGEEASTRLTENPWLVLELSGVQPATADNLARGLLEIDSREKLIADPRRSRALVGAVLRRAARLGHTAVSAESVARDLGGLGVPDPAGAIADAVEAGAALVFADRLALAAAAPSAASSDQDEQDEEFEAVDGADDDDPASMLTSPYTLLALDEWAFAEQSAAEAVQRLLATATPLEQDADFDAASVAGGSDAAEAERIARVVGEAAANGLTLVTGHLAALPGQVAAAFPGAVLASASPAGLRALAEAGFTAVDLRTLGEDAERYEEAEVVVVADAQLVSLELGVELLELLPDAAHLVLCGDPSTLPATGPGRLFRDLFEIDDPEFGGSVPRVELKRRPSGPLSALVDAVRYGGLPPMEILDDGQSNEVKIIPVRVSAGSRLRTVQLVVDSIPRALGFSGTQVQAIAVREQGPAGAEELNAALKERLNPGPGACGAFDSGDRVIVREGGRLVELGLFGGETGTVVEANAAGLSVRFDAPWVAPDVDGDGGSDSAGEAEEAAARGGRPVRLDVAQSRALRHAWVLTLREAQGGRWPAVVAVLDGGSAAALTRSAVLGAFAPAARHLSVVHGAGPALAEAVESRPHTPCRTRLAQALRG
jgi:ATP-dependent exoDNAse (exonuclease V) alpha subunit